MLLVRFEPATPWLLEGVAQNLKLTKFHFTTISTFISIRKLRFRRSELQFCKNYNGWQKKWLEIVLERTVVSCKFWATPSSRMEP